MEDLISVIVSIYNVEDYLPKCIRSIIDQTYRPLEILLIDDGSTDRSGDICDAFANDFSEIRVVHQPNTGAAAAKKTGVQLAKGAYVGFVDGDDWIYPNMYELLYHNMVNTDADISACSLEIGDGFPGSKTAVSNHTENNVSIYEGEDALVELTEHAQNSYCDKLFKVSLFENLDFQVNRIYTDAMCMYKIFDKIKTYTVSDNTAYHYTYRSSSISNEPFNRRQFDIVDAYHKRYLYFCSSHGNNKRLVMSALKALMTVFFYCSTEALNQDRDCGYIDIICGYSAEFRKYPYTECGLPEKQVGFLKMILDNPTMYSTLIQLCKNKK